jgi:hypothetical protein
MQKITHSYYADIKDDQMSGIHSTQWKNEEMLKNSSSENLKENGHLGDLGIYKKLILIDLNEVRA